MKFEDTPWNDVVIDTKEFTIYRDKYPVTDLHELIVPKEETNRIIAICMRTAYTRGLEKVRTLEDVTGFNVGMNIGDSAGQTIEYPHIHLILRRDGDTENPIGGVRNVIPKKGNYLNENLSNYK